MCEGLCVNSFHSRPPFQTLGNQQVVPVSSPHHMSPHNVCTGSKGQSNTRVASHKRRESEGQSRPCRVMLCFKVAGVKGNSAFSDIPSNDIPGIFQLSFMNLSRKLLDNTKGLFSLETHVCTGIVVHHSLSHSFLSTVLISMPHGQGGQPLPTSLPPGARAAETPREEDVQANTFPWKAGGIFWHPFSPSVLLEPLTHACQPRHQPSAYKSAWWSGRNFNDGEAEWNLLAGAGSGPAGFFRAGSATSPWQWLDAERPFTLHLMPSLPAGSLQAPDLFPAPTAASAASLTVDLWWGMPFLSLSWVLWVSRAALSILAPHNATLWDVAVHWQQDAQPNIFCLPGLSLGEAASRDETTARYHHSP